MSIQSDAITDLSRPQASLLEFYHIEATESECFLRLSWDNRKVKTDNALFVVLFIGWLAWTPATLLATVFLLNGEAVIFLTLWCTFGWAGVVLLPYGFCGRLQTEWIDITP